MYFDERFCATDVRFQVSGVGLHGVRKHLDCSVIIEDLEEINQSEVDVSHCHVFVELENSFEVWNSVFVSARKDVLKPSILPVGLLAFVNSLSNVIVENASVEVSQHVVVTVVKKK